MCSSKNIYTYKFDDRSAHWSKCGEVNLHFLRMQQQYFNDLLNARGYVFLRDIYEALGFPVTKSILDAGWHVNGDDTDKRYICFGITNVSESSDYVLTFNADDNITRYFKD